MEDRRVSIAIICPVSDGGHLEHAANLAAALHNVTGSRVLVLTRGGSQEYISATLPGVEFRDVSARAPFAAGRRTTWSRGLEFLLENFNIRRALDRSVRTVVTEVPQYIFPLKRLKGVRVVSIVHNVSEHAQGRSPHEHRIREAIKRIVMAASDRVVIHGARQADTLSRRIKGRVRVVSLPGVGVFEKFLLSTGESTDGQAGEYLCIGEIRRNKNLEEAISAAVLAKVPLRIAGRGVDEEYVTELMSFAAGTDLVRFDVGFLDPHTFTHLLRTSRAVVLPYQQFSAQSGVLERALMVGTPVIAREIPALVEQARGRSGVQFYSGGGPHGLVDAFIAPPLASGPASAELDPRWEEYAQAVFST